ncbi:MULTISPECIES: hypothetical protein [Chromobacterium]|uniref:hypothetical protein n=1 Tax=Chromobacterium TaxID=535 RepID=UPI00188811B5|nr:MULTISPECIES: hypothetical protein [Chromobacterium]QOZ83773.1 hypothetical protein DXT74_12300 [Chromobacterium sp. Rain0013]WON83907.1 hypothetical protein OK026_22845 [Chromobacterium haemolyticum]
MSSRNLSKSQTYNDLYARHGPLIGGADLAKVLGFNSTAAFRQALHKGNLPIEVFEVQNRKGKYALTKDVSDWLESLKPGKDPK